MIRYSECPCSIARLNAYSSLRREHGLPEVWVHYVVSHVAHAVGSAARGRFADLAGELSALAHSERSLHDAPWYPAQIGDVLTIRYAAGGSVPTCEQTHEVVADE